MPNRAEVFTIVRQSAVVLGPTSVIAPAPVAFGHILIEIGIDAILTEVGDFLSQET